MTMKSLKRPIAILILLVSCDEIPLPEVERCTVISTGVVCTDRRRHDGEQEYEKSFEEIQGYQATNPDDYEKLLNDIADKRKELAQLRRRCLSVHN